MIDEHLLGLAFMLKDAKVLGDTKFSFDGKIGRAEDINNLHFGVIGKAFRLFSEEFMLRKAGENEMQKWKCEYEKGKRPTPEVPLSWRPTTTTREWRTNYYVERKVLGAPYGDNRVDHKWIKIGFRYFDSKISL